MTGQEESELLTTAEVAKRLSVTPRTIRLWAESGLLAAIKTPGGHRRFRPAEVERLYRSLEGHSPESEHAPTSQLFTVLVVEDDHDLARLHALHLRGLHADIRVEIASDGYQAMLKMGVIRPQLVIADLEMPHVDGFRMIHAIKAEPDLVGTDVIVITSLAASDIRRRGGLPADVPVYRKPVSMDHLAELARNRIAARQEL